MLYNNVRVKSLYGPDIIWMIRNTVGEMFSKDGGFGQGQKTAI